MRIAKIFAGDPSNQKGQFNNIIERTIQLKKVNPNLDCYMIRVKYSLFLRLMKGKKLHVHEPKYTTVRGLRFRNIWLAMGPWEYFFTYLLGRNLIVNQRELYKYASLFDNYDVLSVHTFEAVSLADYVKEKFGVPFVSTWHGSDINFRSFKNTNISKRVSKLLDRASHNFFVSSQLKRVAERLTTKNNKSVLYTGPSEFFYQYSKEDVVGLRLKYNLRAKYTIGFIGNLIPVKNVLVIPDIVQEVLRRESEVDFLVVGDGTLENKFKAKVKHLSLENVHFLGRIEPKDVPEILNCMNILLLPSFNEGLPRVALEAQACGVHVIGSDRGGIPEAIPKENCFELNDLFVENASGRIIELINSSGKATLSSKFSWSRALEIELAYYHKAMSVTASPQIESC